MFIYEGWSRVPVPISAADVARAQDQRAKAKARTKARAARAALAKPPSVDVPSQGGRRKAGPVRKVRTKGKQNAQLVDEYTDEWDNEEEEVVDWCTFINSFDVCITTYNVLQQDLGVARPPPDRPRRAGVEYVNLERSRSPLIMCEWYRVIMDEVQMAGGGKTE